MSEQVNRADLETKVQAMYRDVAQNPHGEFHFEMGRAMAERLGYRPADLDRIPPEAIDSFAGVGYYFHFLDDMEGARVLDLGSGSGMDSFLASLIAGPTGTVIGLDMTDAQRAKAEALRRRQRRAQRHLRQRLHRRGAVRGRQLRRGDQQRRDQPRRRQAAGVPRDRAAAAARRAARLADIVTDVLLPESISCNTTLWAACIGGAWQVDRYRQAIEDAGLRIVADQVNDQYRFLSDNAQGATRKFGVKSVSLRADKP
jgi:hypothetical protein